MSDLFDPATRRAMLERLENLAPDAAAKWGKMNVGQMLAHCHAPLEIAVGERTMKRGLIGVLFGGLAKRSLLKPGPFGRDMPTAPDFKVTDEREFAKERLRLVDLIGRFGETGPEAVAARPHPFFGRMTSVQWSALQWKHLDHHLRQFGA